MKRNTLSVWIQIFQDCVHPISKKVIKTAVSLGKEKNYETIGVIFTPLLSDKIKEELRFSGLSKIIVFENSMFSSFIPENEAENFCHCLGECSDIILVPATPEGRTLSSMIAAMLKTGVTADCTELNFDSDGLLVQTRPAFSGNIMASIITKNARPQIASLRFSKEIEKAEKPTKFILKKDAVCKIEYEAQWLDTVNSEDNEKRDIIIAIGAGVKEKNDIELFKKLADKIGARLCCSRILVDRGWMQRKNQIGLSGRSVSPKLLITFGISGSIQFRAGLENIHRIVSVNTDRDAPIMKIADVPVVADIYETCEEMFKLL